MSGDQNNHCKFCGKPLPGYRHESRRYCPDPTPEEYLKGERRCQEKQKRKKSKTERDQVKLCFNRGNNSMKSVFATKAQSH
jgi:hypothetical protein